MTKRCVFLFDIDGTLVDAPHGAGGLAFEYAFKQRYGIPNALTGVTLHGNTDPNILDECFLTHLGRLPTSTEAREILAHYILQLEHNLKHTGPMRILPGVTTAIQQIQNANCLLGLATGNVEEGARVKLASADLWKHFTFGGYGSDARERSELVKIAVNRAEKRLGRTCAKNEIWVVGDTPRDIIAAHDAGVPCLAVATGKYSLDELLAAKADELLKDLTEFVL
jgi:phosphoglycolate phosphatase-like HAD superfamily hydrolase